MIPKCYYDKNLIKAINNIINETGAQSYYDLADFHQEALTVICMSCVGDEMESYLIDNDFLAKIGQQVQYYLLTSDIDNAIELAQTMKRAAMQKSESILEPLFAECVSKKDVEIKKENHFKAYVMKDNGEAIWIR